MKKVLLISYYWPPAAGPGVHRWLKMSKYFPENGLQPVVYTPELTDATVKDQSLLKDIHPDIETVQRPIWEPYGFYNKLKGKKKEEEVYSGFIEEEENGPSIIQKLSLMIRGNFFIPDARKFWIRPSVKFLHSYLRTSNIDTIISTGPPHSMHMIALGVKKKNPHLKWTADFRDPWTNIHFYHQLKLSGWADRKHKRYEKAVLQTADKVVTVSNSWANDLMELAGRNVDVISNGYDPDDFRKEVQLDSSFSISHVGSMEDQRNPIAIWKALESLSSEIQGFANDLRIRLTGPVDGAVLRSIKEHGLAESLETHNFLPHDLAIEKMCASQILLLPINESPNSSGVIPGKLFEYLGSRRPIITIGPSACDSRDIVSKTNAGKYIEYEDIEKAKSVLRNYYEDYKSNSLNSEPVGIENFSRKKLAAQYAQLVEELS